MNESIINPLRQSLSITHHNSITLHQTKTRRSPNHAYFTFTIMNQIALDDRVITEYMKPRHITIPF